MCFPLFTFLQFNINVLFQDVVKVGKIPTFSRIKVGTIPTFNRIKVGTIPTFNRIKVGTIPTFNRIKVGTIPTFNRIHYISITQYKMNILKTYKEYIVHVRTYMKDERD